MFPIYRTRASNSPGLKERERPWRRVKGSDNGNLQPEGRKLVRHANYINNLYRSSEVITGRREAGQEIHIVARRRVWSFIMPTFGSHASDGTRMGTRNLLARR